MAPVNNSYCNDLVFGRHPSFPSQVPRLVLLDLKLPKVNGLEVLREMRNDARTRTTPVAIFTSSKEEKDLIEGYRLGTNAYIQKPIDFDQFRQVAKQLGLFWVVVNEPPPAEGFTAGNDVAPAANQ
jgi:two-component system response regulator